MAAEFSDSPTITHHFPQKLQPTARVVNHFFSVFISDTSFFMCSLSDVFGSCIGYLLRSSLLPILSNILAERGIELRLVASVDGSRASGVVGTVDDVREEFVAISSSTDDCAVLVFLNVLRAMPFFI